MAGRSAAPGGDRGGEVVQAPRPARARLTTGACAVAAEVAVVAYAADRAGAWSGVAAAAGAVAVAVLAAGLALRRPAVVPWTLFAAGALYAATLRGSLDGWSIAVGAALLLAAELAYWSIEHEELVREERSVATRRAGAVAGVLAVSLLAGLIVLALAGLQVGAGLPLATAGTAAAAGLLLLVARLARAAG